MTKFTKEDEDLFITFSTYAGVALRNCAQHGELLKAHRRNHVMMSCLEQLGTGDVRQGDGVCVCVCAGECVRVWVGLSLPNLGPKCGLESRWMIGQMRHGSIFNPTT